MLPPAGAGLTSWHAWFPINSVPSGGVRRGEMGRWLSCGSVIGKIIGEGAPVTRWRGAYATNGRLFLSSCLSREILALKNQLTARSDFHVDEILLESRQVRVEPEAGFLWK